MRNKTDLTCKGLQHHRLTRLLPQLDAGHLFKNDKD